MQALKDFIRHLIEKFDLIQFIVAMTIIVSFLAVEFVILFGNPPSDRESFAHLRGMIDMAFVSSLVGYYYGKAKADKQP
jgi:hypothetical protein